MAVDESLGMDGIRIERLRQVTMEGYTAEHDDQHVGGELARMAAAYALHDVPPLEHHTADQMMLMVANIRPSDWRFNPQMTIYNLERAGALIAAEIDRLHRKEEK